MEITVQTRVRRVNGLSEQKVDDALLLRDASGRCYGLESIGLQIWEVVHESITVAELCDGLIKSHHVERSRCETDVVDFLVELRQAGLIEIVD
jgi:hypothetical protein